MDLNSSEIIKTFLKVDSPKYVDKPYYSINENKKTITLYDKIIKAPSDSSAEFEEDKIFTDSDENSYIFEEICLNSVKNAFNGISQFFIFYGDTSSSKFNLSIGDIKEDKTNYNKYGIILRFIDNILKEVNNEEKDIKLEISYFMLNESDIYDLSKIKNKNIDINSFSLNQLNKYKHTIKGEENILNEIQKLHLEQMKIELNFFSKILNLLYKLESSGGSKIFSRSHFCITIYINNKESKKNSLVNFLILNGCESLYSGLNKEFKKSTNSGNKMPNEEFIHPNIVEGSKISLETQYTYETLLDLVKSKLSENINLNEKDKNFVKSKKRENSKLTNILYNMFLNISKINFRIISTVIPSTGQYQTFKDALLFLLDFNKLKKKNKKKESEFKQIIDDNEFKNLDKEKAIQLLLKQKEDIIKKDNKIFILQNDILTYKKEIKEAKKEINQRNEKITLLEKTYATQVNTLKNKLDFKGNINKLIAGDENSDELKYVQKMKDIIYKNQIKDKDIKNLEEKLKEKNDEIKKLKNEIEIFKSNQTLMNYYFSAQKSGNLSKEKKEENEEKNKLRYKIENLEKEIKIKNELIEKYTQDIANKNKILLNLPQVLKETYKETLSVNSKRNNNSLSSEEKEDKDKDKESLDTNNIYENEIKNIKNENKINIKKIKNDCENIIKQKDEDMIKIKYECDKIKLERNNDIKKYGGEIINLNQLLMRLISNYKRIFSSTLTPKINYLNYSIKIDEFDKIITEINREITYDKFPLLFDYLLTNKQFNQINPFLYKNLKKSNAPIMNDLEEKNNTKELNVKFNKIKTEKQKTDEEIIRLSKEKINNNLLNLNDNSINEENKDEIINDLKKKLSILNNKFEKQIIRNNKNEVIIGAQNRKIDRLQKESFILTSKMKKKKQSSFILTPNRSTFYNSSGIDYNSNLSENITNHKNNFNKSLKKSNSYWTINKTKNEGHLTHKPKLFHKNEIDKNNIINKVFSKKLKEFQMKRENSIINSIQNKK